MGAGGDSLLLLQAQEGGKKFWSLAKEWRMLQISRGGGGGRAVGALVICVCTGCLFTFARGGHRVSKDTPPVSLAFQMGDKGSALNCSVPPSPQHCFQEVQ